MLPINNAQTTPTNRLLYAISRDRGETTGPFPRVITYSAFPSPLTPPPGAGNFFKSRFSQAFACEKRLKLFFPFPAGNREGGGFIWVSM